MKAVIVEIQRKNAVALSKSGEFIKLKNDGRMNVGYEVELPPAKVFTIHMFGKAASIAAAFLLVTGIGYGAYSYSMPYSYVDVDINPSIEFMTNRYDRIIGAVGLNDDGKELLKVGAYKNKSIKDGVQSILKCAADQGYIREDSRNAVMVTVSGKNETKVLEIEQEVKEVAKESFGSDDADAKVMVEKTSLERRDEAQKLGLSPGKFLLIERLIEEKPELKVEDLKDEPVKNIMKQINEAKKETKQGKKQGKNQKDRPGLADDNTYTNTDDRLLKQNGKPEDKKEQGKFQGKGAKPGNKPSGAPRHGDKDQDKIDDRKDKQEDKKQEKIEDKKDKGGEDNPPTANSGKDKKKEEIKGNQQDNKENAEEKKDKESGSDKKDKSEKDKDEKDKDESSNKGKK